MADLRRTVLNQWHRAAGAKMADFGGWDMPIHYPTGVVAEHEAVRCGVGVFDVSHMGKLVISGPGAVASLNRVLANDLDRIGAGQAQYTMLCNESGGIIDDLIAYRAGDDEVRLVPNAANTGQVLAGLAALAGAGLSVVDRSVELAIVAVQGPGSASALREVGLLDAEDQLDYMSFTDRPWHGSAAMVCRSGYTGERGYEVIIPNGSALELWTSLCAKATAAGLGARDTLRTEMGYPLHGQDIGPTITPVEAGLGWAVGWRKAQFAGRDALLAQRTAGRTRALRGIRVTGRGIARPGMKVLLPDGSQCGKVTSGTSSPTLRAAIALALVDPSIEVGAQVLIDVRGRPIQAQLVGIPFVAASPK